MKKIFKTTLILFIFCLTFTLSGFFINHNDAPTETENSIAQIGGDEVASYQEFASYVNNYNQDNQYDHIILYSDLDMSLLIEEVKDNDGNTIYDNQGQPKTQQMYLMNTIGTKEFPFMGTFDGNGHKISNLKIDVSNDMQEEGATIENNQYGALFGVTNGATIKNLSIEGSQEIVVGGCVSAYVGGVVAYAKNTTISCVQANSNITCENIYDCNVEMGAIAGCAIENSKIEYCISRPSKGFNTFDFSSKTNKISSFGGLVGRLSSSSIRFCVVGSKFNVEVGSAYAGEVNVGGIVGKVEQSASQIVNVACENSIKFTNESTNDSDAFVNIGEIVGSISNPTPAKQNISHIKFKLNNGISRFGDMGEYSYTNVSLFDMILPTTEDLNSLESYDGSVPTYFANDSDWHESFGSWDFETIWHVESSAICLQAFFKNFKLSFETNDVLTLKTDATSALKYGEEANFEFVFNNGLNKYFALNSLSVVDLYNQKSTIGISQSFDTEGNEYYSIADSKYFAIESKAIELEGGAKVDGILLTIKKVNFSTTGSFSISPVAKEFTMKASTRLYKVDDDGNETLQSDIPGDVYLGNSVVTNKETISYGRTVTLETTIKPNTANRFVGWFLLTSDNDGNEVSIELSRENRSLKIEFGKGYFVDNFEVYARYEDNACLVSFLLDDGIDRIELNSGGVVVEESTVAGNEIGVSKSEASLKLEIFVKKGYTFDEETFIKDNTIYKGGSSDINIFTKSTVNVTDEGTSYLYLLNMTLLQGEKADSFTIKTTTTKNNNKDMTWLWWVLGGVGGAVVLIAIILIIVFARRNRFGGGGTVKYSKKDFKNNYF